MPSQGSVDYFLRSMDMPIVCKEIPKFSLPDGSLPVCRFKMFAHYKDQFPLDLGVASFLSRRIDPSVIDFQKVITGEVVLPWSQVTFTDEAFQLGINKYFPVRKDITDLVESPCWVRAREFMHLTYDNFMRNSLLSSDEEVLDGFRPESSPGFPIKLLCTTKGDAIKNPRIRNYLRGVWERSAIMNAPAAYFTASLKDELRPTEKVKLNKTRMFTAGSIELGLVTSKLFRDQRNKLKKSVFLSPSCIGVRQTRLDFHRLYMQWREHHNPGALDAKDWDGSIHALLLCEIALMRYGWLRPSLQTLENWNRLVFVYRNIVNTMVVFPDGHVYVTSGGMPSGCDITSDDNTLVHTFVDYFSFLFNGGLHLDSPYSSFVSNISLSLYGDDNTYSYNNCVANFFSPAKIIEAASVLGITFEDSAATWDTITFLGHNIVSITYLDKVYHVGVRDFTSILCGWVLGSVNSWNESVERSTSYRNAAFFHPTLFDLVDEYVFETLNANDPNHLLVGLWASILPKESLVRMYFTS